MNQLAVPTQRPIFPDVGMDVAWRCLKKNTVVMLKVCKVGDAYDCNKLN